MSRYSFVVDQPDVVGAWVYERFPHPMPWLSGMGTAIGIVSAGEIVAGVTFTEYNGVNAWMEVAAAPRVPWVTRTALRVVFGYSFLQLGLRRVTCKIDADNARSIKFAEDCGFELETRLQDASPAGDILIYRMFRERCRWICQRLPHEVAEDARIA